MIEVEKITGRDVMSRIQYVGWPSEAARAMDTALSITPYVWNCSIDGEGVCMIGLVPPTLLADHAYIWLHMNEAADKHKFLVTRYSQRFVENILKEWPTLRGHCHIGDDRAVKWVKWLGGTFGEPEDGRVPFVMRRKHG